MSICLIWFPIGRLVEHNI